MACVRAATLLGLQSTEIPLSLHPCPRYQVSVSSLLECLNVYGPKAMAGTKVELKYSAEHG